MTRPRGFIAWKPQEKTIALLGQVQEVLDLYQSELPLTCRQIFYRLVATVGYPKDDLGYERLAETLVKARRASLIPFNSIRDDGTIVEAPVEYATPEEFFEIANELASRGQGVRLAGQPQWVEVWVEAGGMVPQIARAVGRYGITVYSAGGFNGLTDKFEAVQRIISRDVPTVVLHIGDHDPSGVALFAAVAEDVTAFVTELSGQPDKVRFTRAIVTPDQIERYELPTALPKPNDKRSAWPGGGTAQAEGLPPDVLAAEIRLAVEAELDLEAMDVALEQEITNRTAVEQILRDLQEPGS